jgi:hypothetical protein
LKKKRKSSGAPLPLERPEGMPPSPLPDLPDDLKQKQETLGSRAPTPTKQAKVSTPRGKVHAAGPVIPASTKPKGLNRNFLITKALLVSDANIKEYFKGVISVVAFLLNDYC